MPNEPKICQVKKFNFLETGTPSTRHHKEEMGHQLIQQVTHRWRAILTTEGAQFAVSSSRVPLTEYIAVTKRICDELGENTTGKDCKEIYQKTKEVLQHYKKKKSHTHNITKEDREAIKTLREDASHMVLTADKG